MAAKLCLRYLVMTASRSGEARGAMWDEVDLSEGVWRIPAGRMEAGMEHRVTLSAQALSVLGEAAALRDESGLVFPSPLRAGAEMSDMTLTKVLRSTGLAERAPVQWTLVVADDQPVRAAEGGLPARMRAWTSWIPSMLGFPLLALLTAHALARRCLAPLLSRLVSLAAPVTRPDLLTCPAPGASRPGLGCGRAVAQPRMYDRL